ncbi:MAG: hypothetical protein VX294_15840 [Candidatus Latescibacterota bacterium]|nr:hypothetical protein [Candidatus Latescibacterota bacterium]
MPPIEDVIDILRRDKETKVRSPRQKDKDKEGELTHWVRTAPIEEVMEKGDFGMSNFELNRFYGPNQFLHELQDHVMIPWRIFLSKHGYTWQRCAPYIFISMSGVSSTFHADYSHVLAWQVHGEKTFNGFLDPEKYAPIDDIVIKGNAPRSVEVPEHDPEDILSYIMRPGDVLWNHLLTPHWVVAGVEEPAFSINISHGGVRHRGAFLANEAPLRERWQACPEEAWVADLRY